MQPRTKLQKLVVELKQSLPAISEKQKEWAFSNGFEHFVYRTKKELVCFSCGHQWANDQQPLLLSIDGCTCPNCGRNLKVKPTKHKSFDNSYYYCILDTVEEFQVVRFCVVKRFCKYRKPQEFFLTEVVQHWIRPDGKDTVLKNTISMNGYYSDCWNYGSGLEVRCSRPYWNYRPDESNIFPELVYPEMSISKTLIRNGFKGQFHKMKPVDLLTTILTSSKAETLLKAGQIELLGLYLQSSTKINNRWPSIKICIRNKYRVKDAQTWCDHLDTLQFFGKDLLNAKFICPTNLKKEHHRLTELKKKKKLEYSEANFKREKSKFFGLCLTDEDIQVVPLKSVEEFKEEGELLKHCVFTNKYFEKPESLVLSARKGDQRIETVELSLSKLEVIQSRGILNNNTEYHDRIVDLVRRNMGTIAKLAHPRRKSVAV